MKKLKKNKVTIIIPVFNEKNYITEIINRVKKNLNYKKQIIIVDDYSSDGSRLLIKNIKGIDKKIFHKKNLGKGAAIKSATPHIKGNIVIIQDADLEYDPKDLNKLIKMLISRDLKVVYGSRVLNKKKYENNFISDFRTFGNQVLTFISNFFNNQKLTDAHTCYKVFRRKLFLSLKIKEDGFSFCPEVTTKISKLNIKIHEIPISYNGRTISEGKKIRFSDAIDALITIIKYKFFY